MNSENGFSSQLPGDRFRIGDQQYRLVRVSDDDPDTLEAPSGEHDLQLYYSAELNKTPEYQYSPLPSEKKRIRLLKLIPGNTQGGAIYCELFEADYDDVKRKFAEDHVDPPGKKRWTNRIEDNSEEKEKRADEEKAGLAQWEEDAENRKEDSEKKKIDSKQRDIDHRKDLQKNRIPYEALSWCWGTDPTLYTIFIRNEDEDAWSKKSVSRELALALKYLRSEQGERTLWVDAVCIDQNDTSERNHQVQMMSRIYSRADQVCVWLGEEKPSTKIAFDFIKNRITKLKHFDTICNDPQFSTKWQALMDVMQADWFFRRWVIQEIAFGRKAIVYCGKHSIQWKDFAVAVELFVEVESATHRLSEIMQKAEKFRHVYGRFEHVSELGASHLVDATGKVFRAHTTSGLESFTGEKDGSKKRKVSGRKASHQSGTDKHETRDQEVVRPIDPLERRSLLSLEYLVSTMFIFKASEPRDVVYSLIAIARDATPFAEAALRHDDRTSLVLTYLNSFLEEKPFFIDYNRPYSDVCRDFVEFAIRRKHKLDPIQALDILCRPWALEPEDGRPIRMTDDANSHSEWKRRPRQKWKIRENKRVWIEGKLEIIKSDKDQWKLDPRNIEEYVQEAKSLLENSAKSQDVKKPQDLKWEKIIDYCNKCKEAKLKRKRERDKRLKTGPQVKKKHYEDEHEVEDDVKLPGWVALACRAPFSLYHHTGMDSDTAGRSNADPLTGQPIDGLRNYNAAQTRGLDLGDLKFRKRPSLNHYSLYVKGFILDEVIKVGDASQDGNIPRSWLKMAHWYDALNPEALSTDPPEELWRTLVADRGRDNKNPPYYYARACTESIVKGGVSSGAVNTMNLINTERNSIVAEYCRRVHAVIWNRRMFRTKSGLLGLASRVKEGDKVCILFGCTVPIVLKQIKKADDEPEKEEIDDAIERLKSLVRSAETKRHRRIVSRRRISKYLETNEWYQMLQDKAKADKRLTELAAIDKAKAAVPQTFHEKEEKEETAFEKVKKAAKDEDPMVYYSFKGDCYIHGMMDGEALRQKYYDEKPDRVFELR